MADASALCRMGLHEIKDWGGRRSKGCWGTARNVEAVPGTAGQKRYINHACRCECHAAKSQPVAVRP